MEAAIENHPVRSGKTVNFLDLKLPFDVPTIEKLIPHRYPFLLIDRVMEYSVGKSIVAVKNVSATEPVLQGHFPGEPIMPGVLIVEAMAQASAVLGKLTDQDCTSVLLTEVSSARFRRKIIPGDQLRLVITVLKHRKPFYWFAGEAFVGDESVAVVSFSARLA
jgi:3-hydroxyacyl-[acyl-carrier-protein] dehydratase